MPVSTLGLDHICCIALMDYSDPRIKYCVYGYNTPNSMERGTFSSSYFIHLIGISRIAYLLFHEVKSAKNIFFKETFIT